jgi:hypothetical protein
MYAMFTETIEGGRVRLTCGSETAEFEDCPYYKGTDDAHDSAVICFCEDRRRTGMMLRGRFAGGNVYVWVPEDVDIPIECKTLVSTFPLHSSNAHA